MPLSLLNHSALALFAQRTRIPTSARSIGFCAIWVCINSSSSSVGSAGIEKRKTSNSCTGSPFVFMKTSISIKISVIARTKQ